MLQKLSPLKTLKLLHTKKVCDTPPEQKKMSKEQSLSLKPESSRRKNLKTFLIIEETLKLAFPSWPLQNIIAVNPFWKFRKSSFKETCIDLRSILHQDLFMPVSWYLDLYQKNEITAASLKKAISTSEWKEVNESAKILDQLFLMSNAHTSLVQEYRTFTEFHDHQCRVSNQKKFSNLLAKFCAGYFDKKQSLTSNPFTQDGFWLGFLHYQKHDRYLEFCDLKKVRSKILALPEQSAESYLESIVKKLEFESNTQVIAYFRRALLHTIGWASKFEYDRWQQNLGAKPQQSSGSVELLAAAVLLDQCYLDAIQENQGQKLSIDWISGYQQLAKGADPTINPGEILNIWQTALEFTKQTSLAHKIKLNFESEKNTEKPDSHIAMCIDVRSEKIRYEIEQEDGIETLGFAGFFGVGISYQASLESEESHRLPALLKSQFEVRPIAKHTHCKEGGQVGALRAYLRNLRKASFSSFLYIEMLGAYTVFHFIKNVLKNSMGYQTPTGIPARFDDKKFHPQLKPEKTTFEDKVAMASGFLDAIGIAPVDLARIFVVAGHGSQTNNNLMGSALDCGACGGSAGDINARVLVSILNNPQIRQTLARQGILVPPDTVFVAAVHETVTNQIYLLDVEQIPPSHRTEIINLEKKLGKASSRFRSKEASEPGTVLDKSAFRRSANWSETRPEWGLNSNSSFIIAPRKMTSKTPTWWRGFPPRIRFQTGS